MYCFLLDHHILAYPMAYFTAMYKYKLKFHMTQPFRNMNVM